MIKYTQHALENLKKRGISKIQVRKCIQNPDIEQSGSGNKTILLKDFGKNFLKVIVSKEARDFVVITEYWIDSRRVKKV